MFLILHFGRTFIFLALEHSASYNEKTGHFSRNSLPETIKLKNTRLFVKMVNRVYCY